MKTNIKRFLNVDVDPKTGLVYMGGIRVIPEFVDYDLYVKLEDKKGNLYDVPVAELVWEAEHDERVWVSDMIFKNGDRKRCRISNLEMKEIEETNNYHEMIEYCNNQIDAEDPDFICLDSNILNFYKEETKRIYDGI